MFFFTPQERRAVIFFSAVFFCGICCDIVLKLYPPGYAHLNALDVPPLQGHQKLDINRASYEQLLEVKGIGPSTAARILYVRQEKGHFHSLEELRGIKGFSKKAFAGAVGRLSVVDQ